MFQKIIISIGAILLTACASSYENPNLPTLMSESDFRSTMEKYSDKQSIYDGFYQKLGIAATLMNTKTTYAQLDHKARIYQWDSTQYDAEKAKAETSLSQETAVFVSFFVPERKHDDLHKPKTVWKIFLDAGGKRYEGKATKVKSVYAEVQSMYPSHNRFGTPYVVTFKTPVSTIENTDAKLTVTGPITNTSLKFAP